MGLSIHVAELAIVRRGGTARRGVAFAPHPVSAFLLHCNRSGQLDLFGGFHRDGRLVLHTADVALVAPGIKPLKVGLYHSGLNAIFAPQVDAGLDRGVLGTVLSKGTKDLSPKIVT